MKVDVPGLSPPRRSCLASRLRCRACSPKLAPLAADPTSGGAAARLDMASLQLWGAACAQAYSLHKAAAHLIMIAPSSVPRRSSTRRASTCCCPGGGHRRHGAGHTGTRSADPARRAGASAARNAAQRRRLFPAGPRRLRGQGDRVQHHRDEQRDRDRHRGDHRARGGRTGAGPVGQPRRHRRTRGPAQRTRHRAQHDRRPVVRTRRPGAQARRRLQPDGRRDAKPQEFKDERGRAATGAAAEEQHRRIAGCSSARRARTARNRRGGAVCRR